MTDEKVMWLEMNLKMLDKTSQDIEDTAKAKIKERVMLKTNLGNIDKRYEAKFEPLWNLKESMLMSIESMFGGANGLREFWKANPEYYEKFKKANKNFRNRHYYFEITKDEETQPEKEIKIGEEVADNQ